MRSSQSLAIVLLGHGSRHPEIVGAMSELAERTEAEVGITTRPAFLELAEPALIPLCDELIATGVETIVVVPMLFTVAYHARVDVPRVIDEAQARYGSSVRFHLSAEIGTGEDMAEILGARLNALESAIAPSADDGSPVTRIVYAVGSSNMAANDHVEALAARVDAQVAYATTVEPKGASGVHRLILGGEGSEKSAPPAKAVIQPLFVGPGTLWDLLQRRLHDATADTSCCHISYGMPLFTDLAPVIAQRVEAVLSTRYETCVSACA